MSIDLENSGLDSETITKLQAIAMTISKPFCYSCYQVVEEKACPGCGSDDLMRRLEGVGNEYGTDWIVENFVKDNLDPIDEDEFFEEMIRDCYGETTKVGFIEIDTVRAMKELDPIACDQARGEYLSQEQEDGRIFSLDNGSNFYSIDDLNDLLYKIEHEKAD